MLLTEAQWAIVRKAAKYTNGTRVPRIMEVDALRALQALVKAIDAQGASTSQHEPKGAQVSRSHVTAPSL